MLCQYAKPPTFTNQLLIDVVFNSFFEAVEKSNIIILNIFHFSATPTPRKAIVQLNILGLLNLISIDCDDKDEDDFF